MKLVKSRKNRRRNARKKKVGENSGPKGYGCKGGLYEDFKKRQGEEDGGDKPWKKAAYGANT